MGILQFIEKICVQTAVYWGNPRNDGFGQKVYDDPREIKVRWEDKQQVVVGVDGNEFISMAEVTVQEDLSKEGLLYLGTLAEFTPLQLATPISIVGVKQIQSVDKIPLIKSTTQFVRKVYLRSKIR